MSTKMMDLSKYIDDVLTEVSGKHAWDWIARISQYNRIRGAQDYHEIIERIRKTLENYNLDEIKVHKYIGDGKTKTWAWVASPCWEPKSGELWVKGEQKEIICRFQDIPMCIVGYSKSCDVTAELIDVGEGVNESDYRDKDVKGKIVLMAAPMLIIPPIYAMKGALGVIVYPDPKKVTGYRNMTAYARFPAKDDILQKTTFGFSITYEKALHLKELLKEGSITVKATIDAKIFDGEMEVLSAAIYGSENPEEEIIITSHICHPRAGANDNASGSAGVLELVRSVSTLIKNKVLSPPKRTLRFIWIPEFDGMWPWAKEHEQKVKKALLDLNMDMIGEHPLKIGTPFNLSLAPYSRPSILNDVLKYFTKIIADHPKGVAVNGTIVPMNFRFLPYSGGSDQMVFADSVVGIPGVMLGHEDPLWHTSLDEVCYSDPTELKRIIAIALCTGYIFANLDSSNFYPLLPIIEKGVNDRLSTSKTLLLNLFNKILKANESEDREEIQEMVLFGNEIIKSTVEYQNQVIDGVLKLISPGIFEKELLCKKMGEINNWSDTQMAYWGNLCKNLGDDFVSYSEPEEFRSKWSLSVEGLMNLSDLFSIALSKQFEKIKYPGEIWFGDLHELMNLIGCNLELKSICAMMTIQYEYFYIPSKINKFLKFLKRKDFVQPQ